MIRSGWLAALIVVLVAPRISPGQDSPPPPPVPFELEVKPRVAELWTVRIETFNNKGVTGKLLLASVDMECDLGLLEIKLEKIKMIQFSKPHENRSPFDLPLPPTISGRGTPREGTVITTSGESIAGTIYVPGWSIETEMGTLTPNATRLKTLTFLSKAQVVSQPGPRKPGEPPKSS
jgi:hypothetical protein